MMQRALTEKPGNVWEKVFGFIRQITGNVDAAGKGTLQEQIDNVMEDINTQEDCVSVIDEDGKTITTTYADGTKTVTVMDDAGIVETAYDADGMRVSKTSIHMSDNRIEIKELGADEE